MQPVNGESLDPLLAEYARRRRGDSAAACAALLASLAGAGEETWIDAVRALVPGGDIAAAEALARQGLSEHPQSIELLRALGGISRQAGRSAEAETLFRTLLDREPGDVSAAFALAQAYAEAGRADAAAQVLRTCLEHADVDADTAMHAMELLDDCDRERDAAAIAEHAIVAAPDDMRLRAYAGMLQVQLGEFARAHEHLRLVLERSEFACEWHIPQSIAQTFRYSTADHPDFALFRGYLEHGTLSDKARSTLLFALGKMHDDVGEYATAADYFRRGNSIAHRLTIWTRAQWSATVEARLASAPAPSPLAPSEYTPVFIVGMPRSGTTLVAELLARRGGVRNRGELAWIARLAEQGRLRPDSPQDELRQGRDIYARHLRQEYADARWFIDKQPLNFRYLDIILAMWPNARIVHCRRGARDNALSLWMQTFQEEVQGYSCDFSDIAFVMRDSERLMAHWYELFPGTIHAVRYEDLVRDADGVVAGIARWLGLPDANPPADSGSAASGISTASLWQARQPVYTSSLQRWRRYLPYVPELSGFSAE